LTEYRRADRVARSLQDELSGLIRREVRDPRVGDVTITRVDLSGDLREATVWFTPLGGLEDTARIKELEAGLKKAASFLQGKAGRALRLRSTPRLRFRYDTGVENLVHMHEVMQGLVPPEPAASQAEGSESVENDDAPGSSDG
jgi:ribosome-binding factor A